LDLQRPTRPRAKKLNKIHNKIGYPDKWIDYLKLEIKGIAGGSYYENVKKYSKMEFSKDIDKLNKPVDRTDGICHPKR
jgi:predicted metalloendopeptidase